MNCTEITNMSEKQIELLFAEKELKNIEPKDTFFSDFKDLGAFTLEGLDAKPTQEQQNINDLKNKIEVLKAEIKAEKEEAITLELEKNNKIIASLEADKSALKSTRAGKSFVNFYTGKTQFMTFTEINAAKIDRMINQIKEENKELLNK